MHPLLTARRLLLGALAAFVGGTAQAQPPAAAPPAAANQPVAKPAEVTVGKAGELIVPLGGVVRFAPKLEKGTFFTDVLTANDAVVQVRPDADPAAVQLIGQSTGVARITFTLNTGGKGGYDVVVQPDYELLRRVIAKAVPTASIEVIPGVGTSIILGGYVNRPEDAETVMSIARASGAAANVINAIQVGGLQHVQIEVVFASVNRTKLRQRGVDFTITGTEGSFISSLLPVGGANLTVGIVPAGVFLAMQALKTESLAKVLTEPKVVTQSGRPAVIRSGGQQAVLSATGGGLGSISVSLEEVGTTMQVLPIVYGNGKIYLEVSPSIRAVNNGFGIQTTSGFSPGFSEQSAQASVMLESGQTFAIGGLLETTTQANVTKVPVIGEVPFFGTLFSTERSEERESELIILVTPRLVDALDCNQVPKRVPGRETRSVDDYEFYLEGLLEAPRGQRQVWNGRCYQAAWKCDPLKAFPCKNNVCGESGGNCGTAGGNCPTCLPGTTPAPVAPIAPAPMPAPAVAPLALPTAAAPTAEPIVMPQTATVVAPAAPATPIELPTAPAAAETNVTPGPVAPSDVPAPAPVAPEVPGEAK